jgi:hypothetical protein
MATGIITKAVVLLRLKDSCAGSIITELTRQKQEQSVKDHPSNSSSANKSNRSNNILKIVTKAEKQKAVQQL